MWYVYITYRANVAVTFRFCCHCEAFFIMLQLRYLFVRCSYVFYDVRITLYFGMFELRMQERYNYILLLFVIVIYFLLRRNYAIYLFDVVRLFNDVRITFCFGKFKLRMEITLQLRFILRFVFTRI